MKKPPHDYPRPLQVSLVWPIIFLLGCLFLVIFPVIQAPMDTAIGIGIMLSGLPVYFIFVQLRGKIPFIDKIMGKLKDVLSKTSNCSFLDNATIFAQKLLLVLPSDKKGN